MKQLNCHCLFVIIILNDKWNFLNAYKWGFYFFWLVLWFQIWRPRSKTNATATLFRNQAFARFSAMCWKMDFLLFLSGVITTAIALRIYAKMKERQKYASEIIIFPDKSIACKDFFESIQGCCNNQCTFSHEVTGLRFIYLLIFYCWRDLYFEFCVFVISASCCRWSNLRGSRSTFAFSLFRPRGWLGLL